MLKLFRSGPPERETAVAMVGPRPGDALLFLCGPGGLGAADLDLAGRVGAAAGLNGRTVIVDQTTGVSARIDAVGGKHGALLEHVSAPLGQLPFETDTFDVAIIPDLATWPADQRLSHLSETLRVTRQAGRLILIVRAAKSLLFGTGAPPIKDEDVMMLLTRLGTVANRQLARVDRAAYFEARKPRPI
jgi:ubiquinone/menaquinone biosynthesis C-methylase UbiE